MSHLLDIHNVSRIEKQGRMIADKELNPLIAYMRTSTIGVW